MKEQVNLIFLHFVDIVVFCLFVWGFVYKLRVCGNPALSKLISAIFPTAIANFMTLCHILVILTVFQTFSLLLYFLW